MKKRFVLASVLSLGVLLTSCNKDITRNETPNDAVKFSASINHTATKAANDAWSSNDLIGIYMKKASDSLSAESALAENRKYVTTTGDGFFTPSDADQAIYFPVDNSPVDFIAYYPYQATTPANYTIPVNVTDQTSQADIDLMYSNDAVNKNASDANVQLDFSHVLSKLVLNIVNQSGLSLDGLSVTITGMRTGALFNLADGTLNPEAASTADIVTKTAVDNSTAVSEAIVLPTEALNGGKIIFSLGEKSYIWNIPTNLIYTKGTKYTYNFTLKADIVELNGRAIIQDWAEGPAEDIELDKYIPFIDITPSSLKVAYTGGTAEVAVSSNFKWFVDIPAGDSWVTIANQTDSSVTFTATENPDLLKISDIVFRNADGSISKTVKLTLDGYALMTEMQGDETVSMTDPHNQSKTGIHAYMRTLGFDYSENAHCTGLGGYDDGVHCLIEKDDYLDQYVFRFNIYMDPVVISDRCGTFDRQRNEMKSASSNTTWAKVQGNYDEWQVIEWKFKVPAGYQPTGSFCHIHQLKGQDGPNIGSPVISLSLRASSSGGSRRVQIIHSVDGASTGKGTILDNIPLADFEDEWVQCREEIHYTHNGYYALQVTRIRDGKVLIDFKDENIDMWRKGNATSKTTYIRNKFGIYRSLAGGNLQTGVAPSPLLKNESLWIGDIKIYERNTSPNPGLGFD